MDFFRKYYWLILCSIPLLSFALHYHVFSLDLVGIHVWRQAETQTVINNFYRGDFNILNPRVNGHADTSQLHRMEFPVMQWLIALIYKLLGPGVAVTRSVIFTIGLCSVGGMFYLCNNVFKDKGIAAISAWCFNFSPVFYYYTVNPMPDNLALCGGVWSVALFCAYVNNAKFRYVVWSGLCLCLATMAKLPFIIYGSFIFTYALLNLWQGNHSAKKTGLLSLTYILCIIPALAWYKAVIPTWDISAVNGVFDQTWNHPPLWNVFFGTIISVFPELIVNYASLLFFIAGFYFIVKNKVYRIPRFYPFLAWGVTVILYFLFEMNIIDLVHDYYLYPFLPPVFLLVAYSASRLLNTGGVFKVLSIVCFCILPLTAYLRADSRWDTKDPGFDAAYFKYKNELRALTPANALCVMDNDESPYILLYYIDRKGWANNRNCIDEKLLSSYISKGASYLFTDTHMDTLADIKTHLVEKVFEKDALRVYKLK